MTGVGWLRGVGPLCLGAALVVALPVIVVVVLGGGAAKTSSAAAQPYGGLKPGTVPAQYTALVVAAGSRCAPAPAAIIAAQIEQESGWNPTAVSPAGAQGIAQFMPGTWASWAPQGSSPFDPAAAIPAQGRYDCAIAEQMQTWQAQDRLSKSVDVTSLMLAGYNAGPDKVLAAGGIPQNGETPGYVSTIVARAAHFAVPAGPALPGSFAARVVAAAQASIGVPYAWAGGSYAGPTLGVCGPDGAENDCHIVGFDCSGLVLYAIYVASSGRITLDHYSENQVTRDAEEYYAAAVPRGQQRPGDVIGFYDPGALAAHHVGIYVGNGQMIDAPESGESVRVDSLATAYYQRQDWKVVRYS